MSQIPTQKKQEYLSIFQRIQNEKGRLLKQGKTFKIMSKRYFTILADQLVYYKERNSQKIRGKVFTDKKNKQGIKVQGKSNEYQIWIIPDNNEELDFYLFYLSMAKQGNFNQNILDSLSNTPKKSILGVESRIGSLNLSQQQIKSMNFNDMINGSTGNFKKDHNKLYTLDAISALNNNQSIIQIESNINQIQTTKHNAPNIQKEETADKLQNQRMLNSSHGKSGSQFRQMNQGSPQKPINLMSMLDKIEKNKNFLRPEDCNVETTDDIPNTSFMNQYEFSYYRLDNKTPHSHQQPVTNRNSSSVGPQKRINMTKFDPRRSKSSRKEYINKQFHRNLKYTFPFGGDENHNQLEYNEFLGDSGDTSSSIDYDQEQLYPTRKSLQEFEIEEICNDEIIHHKQNKNFTTKKSIKSNYQTSIYQKGNNADILSFENYQDEDIDDAPPGLAKESPLLFQQLEFRKEFVRNSLSQFQNNAKCIDHYKKVKMTRKLNKVKDGKADIFYSEETEMTSFINTENYTPSSSKHLFQLKEMFKKNQIISNLNGSRIQESSSALSIPGYDINDLEDDYYDIKAQEKEEQKQDKYISEELKQKSITSQQLLEDQPYATKNFIQLDNQIRMQASMMKLSDEISQQYLTFTDTEDCLSLVSEKNNIGNQMNNYQSNGHFSKNIFQISERQLFPNNSTSIFEVKKDHILQNKEYFILLATHYIWNSQVQEADYIFSQLQDGFLYQVEISLNLLLITGQIRYLDSSMADYNQIITMIQKKDKSFSQYSDLDKKAMLCEAHMGIGLLKVLQDKKLSALSSINTAHNYLSQIKKSLESTKRKVEISDENKNRYLLVDGLFQIGLSLMPSFFSKIFNLLGISIDLKRGINSLTDCMDQKQLKSNYARIILFLFYLESENNILQSSNLIKSSLAALSTSPIFNWLASLYYWKIASSSNAVKFIKQAIDFCEKQNHQPHFFYFELGWYYLSQFRWNQATTLFENMIIQGFDFKQIDQSKFFKKIKFVTQDQTNQAQNYYQEFIKKYEQNPLGSKVKIMHKCCIAFIIGICYISTSNSSSNPSSQIINNIQIQINKKAKIGNQMSGNKTFNTQNQIGEEDNNYLIHQILSPISQNDQFYSVNKSDTSKQLFPQNQFLQSSYKLQTNTKQNEKPLQQELFYLWCNLALEIYDKLGDSKTLLDIEFRKVIKLFSTRTYTSLIKYELLYFVKELSKVSDENLEVALTEIKQYKEQHIQLYQQTKSEDNLVEICSAYLLIIGICYIKDKFHEINEIANNVIILQTYLNQINKKYQYLSHHAYYWLGMSYKKNYMYQQAKYFFDLSKQFKTNLFNLTTRIEANLSQIIKNMKK